MLNQNIINSNLPILITGEPGVGKSHAAKIIHSKSKRFKENFYCFHVGSSKSELIESDLFGHIQGSFTGAIKTKIGLCELVEDGTLFIDEIADLELNLQGKLLELLEEKVFRKLGSSQVQKFRGKIILATNKKIKLMTLQGKFRQDLYDRISFLEYHILPLRNNRSQIQQLIKKQCIELKIRLSDDLNEFLLKYNWPGNIRELMQVLEYLSIFEKMGELTLSDLPRQYSEKDLVFFNPKDGYYEEIRKYDEELVRKFLRTSNGGINKTTKMMKISKNTLLSKIKKYNINVEQFK